MMSFCPRVLIFFLPFFLFLRWFIFRDFILKPSFSLENIFLRWRGLDGKKAVKRNTREPMSGINHSSIRYMYHVLGSPRFTTVLRDQKPK